MRFPRDFPLLSAAYDLGYAGYVGYAPIGNDGGVGDGDTTIA
jgi:hypothetical protein